MAVTTVERTSAWQRPAYNIVGAREQAAHYAGDNSQHIWNKQSGSAVLRAC